MKKLLRTKATATRWPLRSKDSLNEHLDGKALRSWKRTGGGLRKPCVVTWVTRTADANGRVSPMLPPFLAVVVR